jgi:C-terminal processing protease CtpA/Prc
MKRILFYSLLLILPLLFSSSCKKDDELSKLEVSADTIAINKWIYENMTALYLWNNLMPTNIDYTQENDPEAYFNKLLYKDKDYWSWITNDYASLAASFSGTQYTMGYSPGFQLLADNNTIIIVVEYVFPGSAAEQAGLKRGDIILTINNTQMNRSNYYELYSGSSYSVELGYLENNVLYNLNKSLSLTAQTTTTNPAIYHDIFEVNGTKIGYLVYVEFVCGTNDIFLSSLDNIFNEFKTAGISELIVDLRYNPGGEISAAQHLASNIAPASVIASEELLISMKYNSELEAYFMSNPEEFSDNLTCKFEPGVANCNMQRVYFLTSAGSASASELVISGLAPYMDVIQIGEPTYGKYTGALVIPDDNKKWAMMPIVLKYYNADGYSDFVDGLSPDYSLDDELIGAVPYGDLSDPMVAKAISLATGISVKSSRVKSQLYLKKLIPQKMAMKKNLFFPFNKIPKHP